MLTNEPYCIVLPQVVHSPIHRLNEPGYSS